MTIRIPHDQLATHGAGRPAAFLEAVRSAATCDGADLVLDSATWIALVRQHVHRRPVVQPERPTIATKAARLGVAAGRWVAEGCPVVDEATRAARRAVCEACDLWRPAGNLGLGECSAPGCGCSRVKRWLATERCPLGKWPGSGLQLPKKPIATVNPQA